MKAIKKVIISFLLGNSINANAAIDPIRGALNWKTTDLEITPLLKIQRRYSSRSLHHGWFGFGWCSSFETECASPPPAGEEALLYEADTQNRPVVIRSNLGPYLKLEWDFSGRHIKKIEASTGETLIFRYDGANLKEVLSPTGNQMYRYDHLNNLLAAKAGALLLLEANYDSEQDQLIWSRFGGCEHKLQYRLDEAPSAWIARTQWAIQCERQNPTIRNYSLSINKEKS